MVNTLTKPRSFQSLSSTLGKGKDGTICKTKAADKDPENGTDDYETGLKMMQGKAASLPAVSVAPNATSTPPPTLASATSSPTSAAAEESCLNSKRSIGSKSKNGALRRRLTEVVIALDHLE